MAWPPVTHQDVQDEVAVLRSVVFNVKHPSYGAIGNGTADDTDAIQAAINAAQTAGGGTVFFPRGTYVVSGMPTITGTNITVKGVGASSKILLGPASMNATGTTLGIWVNGGSNIVIEGLCVDGNFANIAKDGTFQTSSSLWLPVISEYGSTSVKVYKMNGAGGSIDATTYLKQRAPIRITNAQNVMVENCLIQNSVSAGILIDGSSVNSCKDIIVTNNRIKMCWDNGVYFHQGVQYGVAANNEISDITYNGVSAVYCDHIMVADNNIRKCGPSDSDSGGIQINGSSNCSVTGNTIDNCQFYGVDLLSTQETNITNGAGGNSVWADSNLVADNHITDCRANDYPTHNAPGVNVFGASNSTISNNTVSGCDFGISMGSRAVNTAVLTNTLVRNANLGINVGNSADVVNTTIRGNLVGYNGSHGVYANAPARYENNTFIGNNGMGINLSQPPSGLPQKIDFIIGNTILDNTDSGILVGGGANSLAVIERNNFGNSYGVMFTDASITYNSTTLTSATANFQASDVGAPIFLINQGANDVLTTATIASVTNSTTVVLSSPAQATQTGVDFFLGRGVAFASGSIAGNTLTAVSSFFSSTDSGKMIVVMSSDPTPTVLYSGNISGYTSGTVVTLGSNVGTYSNVKFYVNRSQGQSARAINNYADNPLVVRDNTNVGIPDYLGGAGTVNTLTRILSNVRDPLSAQDAATKNYVDTMFSRSSVRTSDTAALNTTETVLATLNIPTPVVGTTYRITLHGNTTSTAANTSTFTMRAGTAGSTADASIATVTATAATTGTNVAFRAVIEYTVRSTGATGNGQGELSIVNNGGSGLLANQTRVAALTTTGTLDTTTATKLSITYVSSATTTTTTFTNAIIEIVK